jgi:Family of unknown function (DUF5681)
MDVILRSEVAMATRTSPNQSVDITKKQKSGDTTVPANRAETGQPRQPFSKQDIDKQFKPGQSGNPSGRPVTKLITDKIKQLLAKKVPGKKLTYLDVLASEILKRAIKKSDVMARELYSPQAVGLPVFRYGTDRRCKRKLSEVGARGGGPVWDVESGGTACVLVADCQWPQSRARLKPETMRVTFEEFSPTHEFFDYRGLYGI